GLGDLDGALWAGRQALEIAAARGDAYLQASASYRLAQACYEVGDFGRAVELLRASLEGLSRATASVRRRYLLISSQAWLARVLSVLGEVDEGRRYGEEALRLALEEGPGEAPTIAHGSLGLLYLALGDLESAIPVLERGVATVRSTDSQSWTDSLVGALGTAYGHAGRFAEG